MRRFFLLLSFLLALSWVRSAAASHPLPIVSPTQTNSDGSALCVGCTATTTTVRFNGSSDSATCGLTTDVYYMEVEVRPSATPFSNVATHSSSMSKLSCVLQAYPAISAALAPGSYHWQVRERTTSGGSGIWAPFNGGATAFLIGASLSVTPSSLAFGSQRVGTTSAPQTVTVQAVGSSVTINTITAAAPYAYSGITLPRTLAAGASATFNVTFTPTASGSAPGTLTISSTASPSTVTLSGTGTTSKLVLAPSPAAFGSVRVGSTATVAITATNTGTATLNTSTMTFTGPFARSSGASAGFSLAAGASTTINVTFTPVAEGAASGTLSIASDDPASPTTISLGGTGTIAKIAVSPPSVAFGNQRVGTTSAASSLTITNTGSGTLTVSAISATTPFRAFGLVLPATLAPGAMASFSVEFKPAAIGDTVGTVTITSDADTSPTSVPLTGRGTGGVATVLPPSVAFGSANVGATVTASVSVRNDGNAALSVNSLTFSGIHAIDFSSSTILPVTLSPGATTIITLTFTPGAVGARSGTVSIVTDDPITPTVSVALTGTGASPKIAVTPSSLDFGSVLAGTTSSKLTVKIDNTGDGVLSVTGAALGGVDAARFKLDPVALPLKIAGGSSATVSIAFAPIATSSSSAKLAITSDDPTTPSIEVPLAGVGISPKLTVTPGSIDFGAQLVARLSTARTVEVKNDGTAPLDVTALAISGTEASAFALVSPPALPTSLAPGAKLTLSITIKPAMIGAHSGALAITAGGTTANVTLAGVGISTALTVTPTTIDFGTVKAPAAVGPRTVTITNTSAETLTLKEATLGSTSGFTATAIAGALAPGASKTIDVTFSGAMAGDYMATLTIETTDSTIPTAAVKLTGKALSSWLAVNPSTLDFGEVRVSESSGAQTVTVTNQSTMPIKLAAAASDDPSFVVSGLDLKTAIEPGKSISFGVGFLPTALGDRTGKLGLTVEGASAPELFVTLKGKGIEATAIPDAGPIDSGAGDAAVTDSGDIDNPGLPGSPAEEASGCGCTTPGNAGSALGAALGALALAVATRRRR